MMFTCTCAFNEECPDPLSCVNGTCVVYDGPDIRLPPDDRPNGAACDFGFQCEGTVCVTDPFGGGYCSEFCDTGCPEGWACERGGDSEFAYDLCVEPCGGAGSRDEVCNVRDDDCDTLVDEGFVDANGDYTSVENCGVCGNDCERVLNNATGVECAIIGGTPTCRATECAPGYFSFQDGIACLPLPDNLCQPCTTDGDCLVPTSRCADIGAGVNACTRDCDTDSLYGTTCPTGYTCSDIGGGDSQCVPTGGTCSCTAATEGLERPCLVDPGACPGTEICTLLGNTYDFDACSADGLLPEICDGVDNDCDGSIDEPYADAGGRYTSIEHCGACGNNCNFIWTPAVNHAIASCDTALPVPACRIDMCVSENIAGVDYDWVDANQDTDDGCECRRLSGNTNVDPPDVEFVDVLGTRTYPNASAVYVDENCDGIDGVIGDALFVRAGAAPGGTGTRAQPFATVGAALAAFQASTKAYILVATGIYTESVTLVQGVELHGGYSSDFSRRNIVSFPTVIAPLAPAPGTYTAAIFASSITGPSETVVSGFVLRGYDVAYTPASGPGGATYAAHITDSDDSLALVNNRIVGGEGGRGARGANSAVGFGVFSMGGAVLNGGNGSNPPDAGQTCPAGACPGGSQVVGGAAGTNPSCGGASGILGGSATCPVFPLPSYTPPIPGLDGDPGYHWTRDSATQGSSCNSHMTEAGFPSTIVPLEGGDGRPGAGGNAGSQGLGCASGFGSFVAGVWVPGSAQVGAQGAAGQRGGRAPPAAGSTRRPWRTCPRASARTRRNATAWAPPGVARGQEAVAALAAHQAAPAVRRSASSCSSPAECRSHRRRFTPTSSRAASVATVAKVAPVDAAVPVATAASAATPTASGFPFVPETADAAASVARAAAVVAGAAARPSVWLWPAFPWARPSTTSRATRSRFPTARPRAAVAATRVRRVYPQRVRMGARAAHRTSTFPDDVAEPASARRSLARTLSPLARECAPPGLPPGRSRRAWATSMLAPNSRTLSRRAPVPPSIPRTLSRARKLPLSPRVSIRRCRRSVDTAWTPPMRS
ncbi:MAG: hypothetical protein IPG17_18650 [Sandaracinaceae bacterium]|nr:hypothetical protein [Sandaracinaceae bacterium]